MPTGGTQRDISHEWWIYTDTLRKVVLVSLTRILRIYIDLDVDRVYEIGVLVRLCERVDFWVEEQDEGKLVEPIVFQQPPGPRGDFVGLSHVP